MTADWFLATLAGCIVAAVETKGTHAVLAPWLDPLPTSQVRVEVEPMTRNIWVTVTSGPILAGYWIPKATP